MDVACGELVEAVAAGSAGTFFGARVSAFGFICIVVDAVLVACMTSATADVDVAIISGVDVAISGVLVAVSAIVDVALVVAVLRPLPLVEFVGRE